MTLTADVPSKDFDVLEKNLEVADVFVNSSELSVTNRPAPNGNTETRTLAGINEIAQAEIDAISGSATAAVAVIESEGATAINAFNTSSAGLVDAFNADAETAIDAIGGSATAAVAVIAAEGAAAIDSFDDDGTAAIAAINANSTAAIDSFDTSGTAAIAAINANSTASIAAFDTSGTAAITAINANSTASIAAFDTSGTASIAAFDTSGTAAIAAINANSTAAIAAFDTSGTSAIDGLNTIAEAAIIVTTDAIAADGAAAITTATDAIAADGAAAITTTIETFNTDGAAAITTATDAIAADGAAAITTATDAIAADGAAAITTTIETFNTDGETAIDTFNTDAKTAILNMGWALQGEFEIGAVISAPNDVLSYGPYLYRTAAELPYTVTGATPEDDPAVWYIAAEQKISILDPIVSLPLTTKMVDKLNGPLIYSNDGHRRFEPSISGQLVELEGNEINITSEGCQLIANFANKISYSTEITVNDGWSIVNGGVGAAPELTPNYATSPDLGFTASRGVFSLNGGTSSADTSQLKPLYDIVLNYRQYIRSEWFSIWIKSNTENDYTMKLDFNGLDPSVGDMIITVGQEWKRYAIKSNGVRETTNSAILSLEGGSTSDQADVLLWQGQAADVTTPANLYPDSRTYDSFVVGGAGSLTIPVMNNFPVSGGGFSMSLDFKLPEGDLSPVGMLFSLRGVDGYVGMRYSSGSVWGAEPEEDPETFFQSATSSISTYVGFSTVDYPLPDKYKNHDMHRYTLVYSPTDGISLYIDGEWIGEVLTTITLDSSFLDGNITIGSGLYGIIRNFKIYSEALTAVQVASIGGAE